MLDYKEKPSEYYMHIRREIIDEVPIGSDSVLEVGCAEGRTGATLKAEGRAKWIAGIESMDDAADQARMVLDQVLSGSVEHMDLPFTAGQFDVIILADVLEHLVDPWSTLRHLKFYLKTNGLIIVSLPNVRNWRVLMPLFFLGRWEYQEEGIMDRTHLRFFTRTGMKKMLRECGFETQKIEPTGQRSKRLLRLHMHALSELMAVQYVLVGRLNL
jgi:2-polyprenyl-3-methyl-5-hydroxy-6-metoxy-1,4-benzoquinol methylase